MARPTKYKEEYCQQLVNLMSQGYPFVACCGKFGIAESTGYEWVKKYPMFSESKKEGESKCIDWLIEQGKKGMWDTTKSFNATVWIFMMKNIAHWKDRHETEVKVDKGSINITFSKDEK